MSEIPQQSTELPPRSASSSLMGILGPLAGLAFVFLLFTILSPRHFLGLENLQIILLETAVVGTAAIGATLIIISGGIDLSVGSNIALCTVVTAIALRAGHSPIASALAGVAAGCACGAVIGLLVTLLDLPSFIVTLGLLALVRGVAEKLAADTEIYLPNAPWPRHLMHMLDAQHRWMIFPPGVWIMFALALVMGAVLNYTRFGRHTFAIGSNELTARLCGVRVKWTKFRIYVLATLFAGIAGLLQFSYLNVMGDPTTAQGLELNVIAAVVIGGASLSGGEGKILGTLIGALLMQTLSNGCMILNMPQSHEKIVTGAVIIIAAGIDHFRRKRSQ